MESGDTVLHHGCLLIWRSSSGEAHLKKLISFRFASKSFACWKKRLSCLLMRAVGHSHHRNLIHSAYFVVLTTFLHCLFVRPLSIMAWRSGGHDASTLINNLRRNQLIKSDRVEAAMRAIDRAHYCPNTSLAYQDSPQLIGYGATISAPHMHAMCLELLSERLTAGCNALDVGSGSGYLSAVMAVMCEPNGHVVGIEHIPQLTDMSKVNVAKDDAVEKSELTLITGDGRLGWPERAPYDAIHVGAAAPIIPPALLQQLRPPRADEEFGGRLVIPVGEVNSMQNLIVIDRGRGTGDDEYRHQIITEVSYVPLTSHAEQMRDGGRYR